VSNSRDQLNQGLQELKDLEDLVQLKTQGSQGPTAGIAAARRAAVLLLNAHFEAYLEDVLQEALTALNAGLDASTLRRDFTTPRPRNIDRLFVLLGIDKISHQPSWQKAANKTVRGALEELQDTRNAIAHGEAGVRATKQDVARFGGYVRGFADAVDELIADRIEQLTGRRPW